VHKPASVGKGVAGIVGGFVAFAASLVGILAALSLPPFEDPASALTAAVEKLTAAGSSRIYVTRVIKRDGQTITQRGGGEMNYDAETGQIVYSHGLRQIFRRPLLYQYDWPAGNKVWCAYDLSTLGPGFVFGVVTAFSNHPSDALVNLEESGTYEKTGREDIEGFATTHYEGYVDLRKVAEKEQDPERKKLVEAAVTSNQGRLPLEIWIDDEKIIRRIETRFDFGQGNSLDLAYGFAAYGIPVSVPDPAPADVGKPGERGCPESAF
jgi:hypothetical protein